jgi:hypothetical protein
VKLKQDHGMSPTIRLVVILLHALCIGACSAAGAVDETQAVTVQTAEPTPASAAEFRVLGRCYGSDISISWSPSTPGAPSAATARIGDSSRRYDSKTPFVRDLLDSKVATRLYLLCNNDPSQTVTVTAWGTQFSAQTGAPVYVRAQIVLARDGTLTSYSGLIREDYEIVRRHLY